MKLLIIFFVAAVLTGCRDRLGCELPFTAYGSPFGFDYLDSISNKYLIADDNAIFTSKEVNVTDESGKQVEIKFVINTSAAPAYRQYSRVFIYGLLDKEVVYDKDVCDRVFIKLKTDVDTLDYCYRVQDLGCSERFEKLELKYNGALIRPDPETSIFMIKK